MKNALLFSAALMAAGFAAPAYAGVDEMRFGYAENIRDDHGDLVDGKHGANAELELVFDSPGFLTLIGSPRPYLMASGQTEDGGVQFAGAGLYWRWEFLDGWAFEPGFGIIVHDGAIDSNNASDPVRYEEENQLLGSRDLFRDSFALERELGDHAAVQLYWEHMSHGQIIGNGRNQGLDYVGLRGVIRFTPDPARD
jgi:lipid A 3-O-deacylase